MGDSETLDSRKTVRLWAAATALGVVVSYVAVLLADVRHFYTDDTESQYVPLWIHIGELLRQGKMPGVVPEEWMAGNLAVEGQGSLLNPPQLLVSFIAPSVDNLLVLATVVKLVYSIILALGVFRICTTYGARAQWAAVAGVAVPFSGFILFLDQASWVLALAGTAWLTHAWASAVRYARGRSGPIPLFVFLYFAISVGYVWPGTESALMIGAVAIGEVIYQRKWLPSAKILLAAGCAGLVGAMTYLPSFLSSHVTWRDAEFVFKNDGFMTIPWSETLNASLPSTRPSFTSWFGLIQPFPIVYIAWFLIPALAFIDWKRVTRSMREVSGIAIFAGITLFWTAGPAVIGPLRWPARVLPMVALSLLILVCVLLSRHGTLAGWRARCGAAAVLLLVLLGRSISSAPSGRIHSHIEATLIVAAMGAVVLLVASKKTVAMACALLVVSVAPVAYYMVNAVGTHPMSWNLPERRSEAKAAFPDFDGTTLQLADSLRWPKEEKNLDGVYGSEVVGFYANDLDLEYVNGYTPIGHYWFSYYMCMRWDGSVCPDARRWAFTNEQSTGKPLVDLMKVDRVVLQRAMYPDARNDPPPPGWKWVDYPGHENYIYVLERIDGPVSTENGRISYTSPGVTATSEDESNHTSRARVSSENGGRVVFARIPWPGYHVTLDGKDVEYGTVLDSFLAVDIPPGTKDAELEVTWRPPGWQLGITTAVLGFVGVGILQWLYLRRRKKDSPEEGEAAQPEVREPTPEAHVPDGR
ncbi:hypothetical protein [Antrihabitans sp. YC2-6]|uniref:hypothetical protein n=1 Tax=Antrihabitans sp. YC2-6 TaxID=2799498 RepID=UPI0018F3D051|nr:hypothetical protein [Antrihabitans sp. YC2-6]MBJ8344929.1 hypothetical protein [Antrihabitans sp. YC2-6]